MDITRFKYKPFKHQMDFLNRYGDMKSVALIAEMGTGKTYMAANNFCHLWGNNQCDAVLILAPKGVDRNWARIELPKHMPDWVKWKA